MCIDTFRRTAFFIFMLASSLHAIEEQSYEVIEKLEGFEVRRYHDHIVVETEVNGSFENSGNQGFRRLASYIFGNNEEQTKIAMTAPVNQTPKEDGVFIIQFVLPSKYKMEDLPNVKSKDIQLKSYPSRLMGAMTYSGTWSFSNYQEHLTQLKTAIEKAGYTITGEPTLAKYNPPWTPWFMRRNDIAYPISK